MDYVRINARLAELITAIPEASDTYAKAESEYTQRQSRLYLSPECSLQKNAELRNAFVNAALEEDGFTEAKIVASGRLKRLLTEKDCLETISSNLRAMGVRN